MASREAALGQLDSALQSQKESTDVAVRDCERFSNEAARQQRELEQAVESRAVAAGERDELRSDLDAAVAERDAARRDARRCEHARREAVALRFTANSSGGGLLLEFPASAAQQRSGATPARRRRLKQRQQSPGTSSARDDEGEDATSRRARAHDEGVKYSEPKRVAAGRSRDRSSSSKREEDSSAIPDSQEGSTASSPRTARTERRRRGSGQSSRNELNSALRYAASSATSTLDERRCAALEASAQHRDELVAALGDDLAASHRYKAELEAELAQARRDVERRDAQLAQERERAQRVDEALSASEQDRSALRAFRAFFFLGGYQVSDEPVFLGESFFQTGVSGPFFFFRSQRSTKKGSHTAWDILFSLLQFRNPSSFMGDCVGNSLSRDLVDVYSRVERHVGFSGPFLKKAVGRIGAGARGAGGSGGVVRGAAPRVG